MDKKILIMVLSSKQPPYDKLLEAQHSTWANDPEVKCFFYYGQLANIPEKYIGYGSGHPPTYGFAYWPHDNTVVVEMGMTDDYYRMQEKFKRALKLVLQEQWDIVFRTNSSSYVNIEQLKKIVDGLPTEKLYAGWTLTDSNDDGGLCVSGTGIFLSRDCAEILMEELPEGEACEEDVLIGRILRKHGITAIDDKSRIDYPLHPQLWRTAYHVRFKSGNRLQDSQDMIDFHKKIS